MTKWEYKIVEINVARYFDGGLKSTRLAKKLNELGKRGWELVNIFDTNIDEGKSSMVVANLKREMQED